MSEQAAFNLEPIVERVTLMCDRCTYVYRAPLQAGYYEPGGPDRMCRSTKPGSLVVAPSDAVPGTYYDKAKDPGIYTAGFGHPLPVRVESAGTP